MIPRVVIPRNVSAGPGWVLLAVAGMALLGVPRVEGQQTIRPVASPFVSVNDWAIAALRRLDALGLLENSIDLGDRTPSIAEVERATREAVEVAQRSAPDLVALAAGYRARFEEQYPRFDGFPASPFAFGAAEGSYLHAHGRLLPGTFVPTVPGTSWPVSWSPPTRGEDVSNPAFVARLGAQLGPGLSAWVSPRLQGSELSVEEAYAVAGWRGLGAWAGRRPVGFGPALGGGVVLNGITAFDGAGVFLRQPVRLPWVLGRFGSVDLETFLSRSEDSGEVRDPLLWAARATLMPHRRLTIGLNRAAMFGGDGEAAPTLLDLLYAIVGEHTDRDQVRNFENQVASVDARWRVPVPVPLEAYGEWGFEDSAGAWKDVPGIVAGISLPALPGVPEVGIATEYAFLKRSCCGNPDWYRHRGAFWNGWVQGGEPLGHPLAGHGRELRLRSDAALFDTRLRLGLDFFARNRGDQNLFAPDREGGSRGGDLRLELTPRAGASVVVRGRLERGDSGWQESDGYVGVRWSF
jgi:hypothetical protein